MSGERAGRREAMDRLVKQLVNAGNAPGYAKQVARDQAIKKDRKEDKKNGS